MKDDGLAVSAMIFTLNEELHLPACLSSLAWCDDVIVVDSGSSDRSIQLCEEAGARVFHRTFDGFGSQRNWALASTQPRHPWVLILDADERVPPEMVEEMRMALPATSTVVAAFRIARRFYFWGKWLRYSSLYPTYVVRLVRLGSVHYVNRGHAESQVVEGEVRRMRSDLIDENKKGLAAWFERQNRYSSKDAEYELEQEGSPWRIVDLLSRDPLARRATLKRVATLIPGRPIWYFFYSYFLHCGFRDGASGFVFCAMRSIYQFMVAVKKYELRQLRVGGDGDRGGSAQY